MARASTLLAWCRDFDAAVRPQLDEIHPQAAAIVHEQLADLREAADDPAEVARLVGRIDRRLARERRYNAENEEMMCARP